MQRVVRSTVPRRRSRRGASSAEYSVLLGVIAGALVFALMLFGDAVTGVFQSTAHTFGAVGGPGGGGAAQPPAGGGDPGTNPDDGMPAGGGAGSGGGAHGGGSDDGGGQGDGSGGSGGEGGSTKPDSSVVTLPSPS